MELFFFIPLSLKNSPLVSLNEFTTYPEQQKVTLNVSWSVIHIHAYLIQYQVLNNPNDIKYLVNQLVLTKGTSLAHCSFQV